MGFPFLMWGGGDGSSDIHRGASGEAGAAGAGAAVGAASGSLDGQNERNLSEEEQIYGPQAGQAPRNPAEDPSPYDNVEDPASRGYEDDWVPENEETMDDPWADEPQEGGMFGGGGGGGGDIGDWGDWS